MKKTVIAIMLLATNAIAQSGYIIMGPNGLPLSQNIYQDQDTCEVILNREKDRIQDQITQMTTDFIIDQRMNRTNDARYKQLQIEQLTNDMNVLDSSSCVQ